MTLPFISLFRIIMEGKAASRFLLGAIASFSFSIAVILCTIGLMDGFENTLKSGLSKSVGDLSIYRDDSFFYLKDEVKTFLETNTDLLYSPMIQTEGFILGQNDAKGILIKGVDAKSFTQVTGLEINLQSGEIAIGKELFENLGLAINEAVTIAFGTNSEKNQGAPILKNFIVTNVVHHAIYEKDLRFVYLDENDLREVLNLKKSVYNNINVKILGNPTSSQIENRANELEFQLKNFRVVPYWKEFQTLLDAVEVEKLSIGLVLQLIVIVAIFNVIAFIIFISEKKSQEFFLLRALGLNLKSVVKFWSITVIGIWFFSCLISIGLAKIFNFLLMNLSLFKLPGEIYVLSNLSLKLGIEDYILVFGASFLWMMFITIIALLRLRKKALIYGLRQEFA